MKATALVLTYRFRIKGASSVRRLNALAKQVNLVWNFCNETSFNAIRNQSKWISNVDLDALLAGTSKLTGLHSQSIQAISKEYVTRRVQHKKRKLRWRISQGSRKSLGWIPFKASGIKVTVKGFKYSGWEYRVWNSWDGSRVNQRSWKEETLKILCGSFSEDADGHWYLNLTCEVKAVEAKHCNEEVGIDPGLKNSVTLSDGVQLENPNFLRKLEKKLAKAQRARHRKQVRKIHRKIKNQRKEALHRLTTKIARNYRTIFIGDVSGKFLQRTNGKSSADASVGVIQQYLKYKAMRHSGRCIEVFEGSSTILCSTCHQRTGPSGLRDLGVREWICTECGVHHDRDVNSARNILRFGRESLKQLEGAA